MTGTMKSRMALKAGQMSLDQYRSSPETSVTRDKRKLAIRSRIVMESALYSVLCTVQSAYSVYGPFWFYGCREMVQSHGIMPDHHHPASHVLAVKSEDAA